MSISRFLKTSLPIICLVCLAVPGSVWGSISDAGSAAKSDNQGLRLIGVVAFEKQSKALISVPGMDEEALVGEGDLVNGYTVRRIEEDHVELVRNGGAESIWLPGTIRAKSSLPAPASSTDSLIASSEAPRVVKRLRASSGLKKVLVSRLPVSRAVASSSSPAGVWMENGRPRFIRPLNVGYVSSPYGWRARPGRRASGGLSSMHKGADIAAPTGTPVGAAAEGVVSESTWSYAKGNYIVIRHSGGYSTAYFHLSRRTASVGQRVQAGDQIGHVGNTGISYGAHLHFEILINGSAVDPANYIRSLNSR